MARGKVLTVIRDPRPVSQQVKSGLKIGAILLVVLAAVLVCISVLPIRRIEAWTWHLRHGSTIRIGDFRVPVPSEWYVDGFDSGDVMLINTEGGRHYWATVMLSGHGQPNLTHWETFKRRSMESIGMRITDVRRVEVAGVSGVCLDGESTLGAMQIRNISCSIGTDLSLDYIGSYLKAPAFYSIVTGVCRVHHVP